MYKLILHDKFPPMKIVEARSLRYLFISQWAKKKKGYSQALVQAIYLLE